MSTHPASLSSTMASSSSSSVSSSSSKASAGGAFSSRHALHAISGNSSNSSSSPPSEQEIKSALPPTALVPGLSVSSSSSSMAGKRPAAASSSSLSQQPLKRGRISVRTMSPNREQALESASRSGHCVPFSNPSTLAKTVSPRSGQAAMAAAAAAAQGRENSEIETGDDSDDAPLELRRARKRSRPRSSSSSSVASGAAAASRAAASTSLSSRSSARERARQERRAKQKKRHKGKGLADVIEAAGELEVETAEALVQMHSASSPSSVGENSSDNNSVLAEPFPVAQRLVQHHSLHRRHGSAPGGSSDAVLACDESLPDELRDPVDVVLASFGDAVPHPASHMLPEDAVLEHRPELGLRGLAPVSRTFQRHSNVYPPSTGPTDAQLQNEIAALENFVAAGEAERRVLEDEIQRLLAVVEENKSQLLTHQYARAILPVQKAEIEELKRERDQARAVVERVLEACTSTRSGEEASVPASALVRAEKRAADQAQEYEQELSVLREHADALETEITLARTNLEAARRARDEYEAMNAQLNLRVRQTQRELEHCETNLQRHTGLVTKLKSQVSHGVETSVSVVGDLQRQLSVAHAEIKRLQGALAEQQVQQAHARST